MARPLLLAGVVLGLAAAGCRPASTSPVDPGPDDTDSTPSLIELLGEDAPVVELVNVFHKDAPEIGVMHRSVRLVWHGPLERERVEACLRRAYEAWRAEIERKLPHGNHRWIRILMASSRLEYQQARAFAECASGAFAGPELAPWPPPILRIDHRDPATRPGVRDEQLYAEWLDELWSISERDLREPKRDALRALRRREFLTRHQLTEDALDRLHWRFRLWWEGRPATDDAVEAALAAARAVDESLSPPDDPPPSAR
jgi:hypothetical protein